MPAFRCGSCPASGCSLARSVPSAHHGCRDNGPQLRIPVRRVRNLPLATHACEGDGINVGEAPDRTRRCLRDDAVVEPVPVAAPGRREWWRAFGEGVVVQLANPKASVFMLAFYPQFVPADQPLFVTTAWLALLQVALETGLYLGLAAGVARAGHWFARASVRRRLETVTGTVLVSLGARMAFMSRAA